MSPIAILKLLKTAKDIHDYVKKPNNLDAQNDMILQRLEKLEQNSHPIKDFVTCECCKKKLRQKDKDNG